MSDPAAAPVDQGDHIMLIRPCFSQIGAGFYVLNIKSQDHSCKADRINAHIQEGSAPKVTVKPPGVRKSLGRESVACFNKPNLSDLAFIDPLAYLQDRRQKPC